MRLLPLLGIIFGFAVAHAESVEEYQRTVINVTTSYDLRHALETLPDSATINVVPTPAPYRGLFSVSGHHGERGSSVIIQGPEGCDESSCPRFEGAGFLFNDSERILLRNIAISDNDLDVYATVDIQNSTHIHVSNVHFLYSGQIAVGMTANSTDCYVRNCAIKDARQGITVGSRFLNTPTTVEGVTIRSVVFENTYQSNILIGANAKNVTVMGCKFSSTTTREYQGGSPSSVCVEAYCSDGHIIAMNQHTNQNVDHKRTAVSITCKNILSDGGARVPSVIRENLFYVFNAKDPDLAAVYVDPRCDNVKTCISNIASDYVATSNPLPLELDWTC